MEVARLRKSLEKESSERRTRDHEVESRLQEISDTLRTLCLEARTQDEPTIEEQEVSHEAFVQKLHALKRTCDEHDYLDLLEEPCDEDTCTVDLGADTTLELRELRESLRQQRAAMPYPVEEVLAERGSSDMKLEARLSELQEALETQHKSTLCAAEQAHADRRYADAQVQSQLRSLHEALEEHCSDVLCSIDEARPQLCADRRLEDDLAQLRETLEEQRCDAHSLAAEAHVAMRQLEERLEEVRGAIEEQRKEAHNAAVEARRDSQNDDMRTEDRLQQLCESLRDQHTAARDVASEAHEERQCAEERVDDRWRQLNADLREQGKTMQLAIEEARAEQQRAEERSDGRWRQLHSDLENQGKCVQLAIEEAQREAQSADKRIEDRLQQLCESLQERHAATRNVANQALGSGDLHVLSRLDDLDERRRHDLMLLLPGVSKAAKVVDRQHSSKLAGGESSTSCGISSTASERRRPTRRDGPEAQRVQRSRSGSSSSTIVHDGGGSNSSCSSSSSSINSCKSACARTRIASHQAAKRSDASVACGQTGGQERSRRSSCSASDSRDLVAALTTLEGKKGTAAMAIQQRYRCVTQRSRRASDPELRPEAAGLGSAGLPRRRRRRRSQATNELQTPASTYNIVAEPLGSYEMPGKADMKPPRKSSKRGQRLKLPEAPKARTSLSSISTDAISDELDSASCAPRSFTGLRSNSETWRQQLGRPVSEVMDLNSGIETSGYTSPASRRSSIQALSRRSSIQALGCLEAELYQSARLPSRPAVVEDFAPQTPTNPCFPELEGCGSGDAVE